MWHKFNYIDKSNNGRETEIHSSIVTIGENTTHTGMSKTVGLPLGIATRLILEDKIESRGVIIPIIKEFYEPILSELSEDFGFDFTESCVLTPRE
jgi:saccharopine dehydrogenase (NADP+, L-glutamate forming)